MHLSPLPTSDRILSVLGSGSVCVNSLSNVPPIGLSGFCVWSLGFGSRFVMRYTSTMTLPHSAWVSLQCVIVSLFANVYFLGVLSIPNDNNRLRQVSFSVFFHCFII